MKQKNKYICFRQIHHLTEMEIWYLIKFTEKHLIIANVSL